MVAERVVCDARLCTQLQYPSPLLCVYTKQKEEPPDSCACPVQVYHMFMLKQYETFTDVSTARVLAC